MDILTHQMPWAVREHQLGWLRQPQNLFLRQLEVKNKGEGGGNWSQGQEFSCRCVQHLSVKDHSLIVRSDT